MNYAVIMAGGSGKRLWPLSREKRPKQVLRLLDGQTLLERCFERLSPIFDNRNIIVLTNVGYADIVRENLPHLPFNNVIAEPAIRDTAGAIGLAAAILNRFDPESKMVILTADQVISPPEVLQQALKDSFTYLDINPEALITFGIKPTFASTQLGYINCIEPEKIKNCKNEIYTVKKFSEKPKQQTAEKYLKSGSYFWNSGMFVWKTRTILDNLKKLLPESCEPLSKIAKAWDGPEQQVTLEQWFIKLPKISIDFAVMEKAKNVHAIKLDCRWLDMGSFTALQDVISADEKNNIVVAGISELLDCKNSVVITEDKNHLIAAIGLENIVVAHTPDATLICHINQTDRLKELLTNISERGKKQFL